MSKNNKDNNNNNDDYGSDDVGGNSSKYLCVRKITTVPKLFQFTDQNSIGGALNGLKNTKMKTIKKKRMAKVCSAIVFFLSA